MGSHKTKNQLEIELNELKQLYGEKCSECDFLTKDNRAKSEAATNACADLKNTKKDLEDARAELQIKEACNKKLADQFYGYRTELVKARKELADAIEKRDSFKVELEGVRGALKRESELRADAEKKRDEYKQEMVKWKNEAGQYRVWWESVCRDNELLKNFKADVEKIMQKYCILTMDSLDNQLRHWKYTDNKLSHDLCMPLESLIHMLDEYDVNDFCKLRERLMYGPTADYSNALANVRKLEKENKDLKAVADDLEKQRRELEQKLVQEHNVAMVQEARATDLEGQLRRQTDNCKYWTDRAFRDEEELKKSMEHDRIAQENFEKAARRNDELQNEVNKLYQRWTDEFNPEDEFLGHKVADWQEFNAILARYNTSFPDNLAIDLEQLGRFRQLLRDWHFRTIDEFSTYVNELHNYKIVCQQNLVGSTDELKKSFDELKAFRLRPVRGLGADWRDVIDKHKIESAAKLDARLSCSCPEEYLKVFCKYGIGSVEKLEQAMSKLNRISVAAIALKNNVPYLGSIADLVKELA